MAHFAYTRVSTTDQTTENQKMEIEKAGFAIAEWFSDDGVSGYKVALFDRPAFKALLSKAVEGDCIVVTKVDRLGRSASDVLVAVKELQKRGFSVKIIQLGGMDVTSSAGKLMLTMLSAVAEMERDALVERTNSGIARTKAQGTKFGRPLTIEPAIMRLLVEGRDVKGKTFDMLAEEYGIPRNTVHRNVTEWRGKLLQYEQEFVARKAQYAAKAA